MRRTSHPLRRRKFWTQPLRAAPLAPHHEGSIQKHSTFNSMHASRTPTDEMIAPSAPRFRLREFSENSGNSRILSDSLDSPEFRILENSEEFQGYRV